MHLASFLRLRVLPVQDAAVLCLILPQLHGDTTQDLASGTKCIFCITSVQNQQNELMAVTCTRYCRAVASWRRCGMHSVAVNSLTS